VEMPIEAVYFINKIFSKEVTHDLELKPDQFLVFPTFINISIVTTHKVSQTTCFFCQVNYYFITPEDGNR
jgi:hypothetical protein